MLVLLRYSFQNESICNNAESKVARRKTHPYQPITFTNTGMKLLTHADYHLSLSLSLSLCSALQALRQVCGFVYYESWLNEQLLSFIANHHTHRSCSVLSSKSIHITERPVILTLKICVLFLWAAISSEEGDWEFLHLWLKWDWSWHNESVTSPFRFLSTRLRSKKIVCMHMGS